MDSDGRQASGFVFSVLPGEGLRQERHSEMRHCNASFTDRFGPSETTSKLGTDLLENLTSLKTGVATAFSVVIGIVAALAVTAAVISSVRAAALSTASHDVCAGRPVHDGGTRLTYTELAVVTSLMAALAIATLVTRYIDAVGPVARAVMSSMFSSVTVFFLSLWTGLGLNVALACRDGPAGVAVLVLAGVVFLAFAIGTAVMRAESILAPAGLELARDVVGAVARRVLGDLATDVSTPAPKTTTCQAYRRFGR
jgi:hypothetical protein